MLARRQDDCPEYTTGPSSQDTFLSLDKSGQLIHLVVTEVTSVVESVLGGEVYLLLTVSPNR